MTKPSARTRPRQGRNGAAAVLSTTERRQMEALLSGQNQALAMIARGAALAQTLDKLLRVLEDQSPEMLCSILLLDAAGAHLRHGAAPSLPEEYMKAIDGGAIGPSAGSCGTAAFRREAVIVEDIATDPLWVDYRALALPHGLRACWSTPIFDAEKKVLGTFAMYYRQPGRPTAKHQRLIEIGTQIAAIAISHEHADEALRRSETKFRTLHDSAPDGVLLLDENGFFDCNPAALVAFGCADRGELCSKGPADLSPALQPCGADSLTLANQRIAAAMATGSQRFEWVHQRVDTGATFPAEVLLHAMVLDGKKVLQVVVRDISERKKAEEEARILTQRLTLATDAASIGVWDWDVRADQWFATPKYFTMLGYEPEEGLADRERWIERVHPEDRAAVVEKIREVLAGSGEPYQYDARIRHADGSYRWIRVAGRVVEVDAQGKASRLLGVRLDITERKRAEAALRENEDRYRDLIDNSQELISTCDLEGNFLSVNETTVRITGYPREVLLKMNLVELLVPEARHLVPEYLRTLRASGKAKGIMRIRTAKGERRFWEYDTSLRTEGVDAPVVRAMALDITERLRSERALRASESELQVILEATNDGILAVDSQGRILKTNLRFAELWQIPPALIASGDRQALLDHVLSQVSEPAAFLKKVQALYASDATALDLIHFKDGRCFERFSSPMLEGTVVTGRVWSFRDVTERKRAEKALLESYERFELATRATFNVIWDWDLKTQAFWRNENFRNFFGFEKDDVEASSRSSYDLIHPDDLKRVQAGVQAALVSKSEFWSDEYRFRRKDGSYATVEDRGLITRDADGHAIRMLGAMQDISERKRAEASLLLQSGALEAAANTIVITDRQGLIEWANQAFTTATGYSVTEAIGKRPGDLIRSGLQDALFYKDLWTTILAGEVWRGELVNKRKDGSLFTEEMTITPLRDAGGEITHFVAVKQDVTQRKLLEERFLQAQKLEAVGRLAGGVAHDFNNMLGVILGYTDIALGQVDSSQPLHKDLREIHKAAERSAGLTRQLLAFARKETITPKVLNLNETVAGMLTMLTRLIGEDIQVTFQPAATLWPVLMDPSQFDQILANLCVNSRDAIAGVGAIAIATANCAIDADDCATNAEAVPGDHVRLSVSDTGRGMDPETLGQIFEPFFTTKAVGEGTGLGLPMVYGAVKQNLGFLTVASEPGHGTVVEIFLPRHMGRAERARTTDADAPVVRGHETILVVEDEAALLKLIARVLAAQGYSVIAASSPGEAIGMARERGDEIHLLLTDVVMPEMNGRDLAKTLLSLYPRLRRLFMSGYTAEVIGQGGLLEEGVHFLQKPFSQADLAARVRAVLDGG